MTQLALRSFGAVELYVDAPSVAVSPSCRRIQKSRGSYQTQAVDLGFGPIKVSGRREVKPTTIVSDNGIELTSNAVLS